MRVAQHYESKRRRAIAPDEIELADVSLQPEGGDGYFTLRARVRNRADVPLTSLTLRVIGFDCPEAGAADCDRVGEIEDEIPISVPPQQARGLNWHLWFEGMPKTRHFSWAYQVVSRRADL
jgi:hypothetical protein